MRFERVSFSAFADDMAKYNPTASLTPEKLFDAWNEIQIPTRATEYSAGYDLRIPIDITIPPGERRVIPTGLRAVFSPDELESWHLQMYVRSSIGIRDGVVLMNGTGIIDPDYQFAKNGGDMMLALVNTSNNLVKYKAGDRVCQAVFCIHGIAENDAAGCRTVGGGTVKMQRVQGKHTKRSIQHAVQGDWRICESDH